MAQAPVTALRRTTSGQRDPAQQRIDAMVMKAMKKGMKRAKTKPSITASEAYDRVATATGLQRSDIKKAVEAIMDVAGAELKKNGSFKIGGCINTKIKNRPARKAMKGTNPFTGEPCMLKARKASKTVRALPMKKLKD